MFRAIVALIASLMFSWCAAAADQNESSQPAHSQLPGSPCVEVAPLDDRYPIVVSVESLPNIGRGLERLQRLRATEACIRIVLGIHAKPEVLLASLRDIRSFRPDLLRGLAIVPLSSMPEAAALIWHAGLEQRFTSVEAAAAAARAYIPVTR